MSENSKLHILWTNDNLITAEKMVFMYGINSKRRGWWDEVTIIIWGATVQLTSESRLIQELIEEAKLEGVHVTACQSCAEQLGVADKIAALNIELIFQGEPLTAILKNDEKLITI